MLSARRIPRARLVPFALLGSVLLGIYSIGAEVYVPHLFSTYATRYGVIGAVFAIISSLFCIMVVTVGSAAAGREIADELERIRKGERPADDEVRAQWHEITAEARSRWETLRTRKGGASGEDGEEQEGGEEREVHAALLQGGPPGQDGEAGHDDRDREQHGLR